MGVRARQVQGTDYAGFRGQARTAGTVSKAFDQMSGFLETKAQEEAARSGLERVRTEGAQPLLEQLQAQGGPRGLEEQTAYEAANRIAVAEIRNEAELEITRILDKGQTSGQSYSAIQAQLKDVTDGFPAALSDIDPVNAGLLRTQLQNTATKAEMRYSKWWTGKVAAQRKANQNNAASNNAEFAIGNATIPGYTTKEIDADIADGAQHLLDMGVSQDKVATWSQGVREKAYKENTLFNFYQKPVAEQKAEMEQILEGKKTLPGMDYEQSVRFVNGSLRPEYNRNVSALKSQSDFVVNKAEDQAKLLEDGGRISEDVISSLRDQAIDVEEFDGGAALAALNDLQESDAFFSELRGASLSEVEEIVIDLESGTDGARDTAIEQKRYDQAKTFLTNMETQLGEDPMGFAERVGFIETKPIVGTDESGNFALDGAALEQRVLDATRVQSHYGLSEPKLLRANEARQLSLVLDRAEGGAKLQVLGTLAELGEASGQVLSQVAEYSPEMAMVGGLVNAGSTQAAAVAVAGLDRLKAGEKPNEFTPTNTTPVVQDLFGTALSNSPKQSQAILGVAEAIYVELSASRPDKTFNEDLYEKALQMAAGQTQRGGKTFGGVQEVRGMPTFIDPQRTSESYNQALENLNGETVFALTGQRLYDGMAEQIKENEDYKLMHVGGDKYVFSFGGTQSTSRLTIRDVNDDPVIFSMNRLIYGSKLTARGAQ
jgi:hypothetical protein